MGKAPSMREPRALLKSILRGEFRLLLGRGDGKREGLFCKTQGSDLESEGRTISRLQSGFWRPEVTTLAARGPALGASGPCRRLRPGAPPLGAAHAQCGGAGGRGRRPRCPGGPRPQEAPAGAGRGARPSNPSHSPAAQAPSARPPLRFPTARPGLRTRHPRLSPGASVQPGAVPGAGGPAAGARLGPGLGARRSPPRSPRKRGPSGRCKGGGTARGRAWSAGRPRRAPRRRCHRAPGGREAPGGPFADRLLTG